MSYNNIKIFEMTLSDFELIKDNLLNNFDDFWNPATLKNELLDINSCYLVAKQNNEIVGFCGMKIILDEADIMNVVVKKEKRNLGIGTYILNNLILMAKSKKIHKLTLEVNYKNSSAIRLYKKAGFKEIAIRKKYYKNVDDAVIMQLVL